jgi:putative addiction module killer protein
MWRPPPSTRASSTCSTAKGDWRPVGEGVCELRFLQTGPGWRVYFHETNRGTLILLLLGGNKSSQQRDIQQRRQSSGS